jgi:hypothetical protein
MGTRAAVQMDEAVISKQFDGDPECLGAMLRSLSSAQKTSPETVKNAIDSIQSERDLEFGLLGPDGEPVPYTSDCYIQSEIPDDIEYLYSFQDGDVIMVDLTQDYPQQRIAL